MTTAGPTFHIPNETGLAAMVSLDAVPWDTLRHAYGVGIGPEPHENVPESLRLLATDRFADGMFLLYSNICHQGTIYEATAHAVPFLACYAAGPDVRDERIDSVVLLLAEIWLSATTPTKTGTSAGAYGDDVGPRTHAAFVASQAELNEIRHTTSNAELAVALTEVVRNTEPSPSAVAGLQQAFELRIS